MKVIWNANGPITVSEILGIFTQWKNGTVATMLARLIDKGYLTKELKGKVNFYTAIITEQQYATKESKVLLKQFFRGNLKNFIVNLVDTKEITLEDIKELKEWFDKEVEE